MKKNPTKAVLVGLEIDLLKNRSRINEMQSDYIGRIYCWQVIISKTKMCSIKCIPVFYKINVKHSLLCILEADHIVKNFRPWEDLFQVYERQVCHTKKVIF